jgi:hypothetical protein
MWTAASSYLLKPVGVVLRIPDKHSKIPLYVPQSSESSTASPAWLVGSLDDADLILVCRNQSNSWYNASGSLLRSLLICRA